MASKAIGFLNFKFGADLKGFDRAMKKAQKNLKKFGKNVERTGKNLTSSLTLPIAGLAAVSLKTFADFEQGMLKVKAISGATDVEFKALTESAKLLGSTTMFTAAQVAELQLNLSKLGLTPTQINQSTESILNLAQATDSDLAQAATVTAKIMNAFGMEATEMQRITDVMADSFSSTALDMAKFETAMASVAPVAKMAGADIEKTTAILGVLVNNGVEASTAGTALRNIFLDLSKSGKTWDQAMNEINSSTEPLAVAMDMFGKRGANVATILAQSGVEIQNLTSDFRDSTGEAKAMAEIMDSGVAGSLRKMRSQLEGAAIQLGETLVPVFQAVINRISKLVTWFSNLSTETQKSIVKWALWVAALGPALIILGKISLGISSLIKMLVALRTVTLLASTSFKFFMRSMVRMTAAGWAANGMLGAMTGAFRVLKTAIMTNPIGILIGTLALAAGAFLTYTQATKDATAANDEFEGTVETTEEAIKRIAKSVGDMGKDSMQLQIEEIEALIKKIKGFEIKESQFTKGVGLSKKDKKQIQDLNMLLFQLKQKQFEAKQEADELDKSMDNLGVTTEETGKKVKKTYETLSLTPQMPSLDTPSENQFSLAEQFDVPETIFEKLDRLMGKTKEVMQWGTYSGEVWKQTMQSVGNELAGGAKSFEEYGKVIKGVLKDAIGGLISKGVAAAVSNALSNPALAINPLLIPVFAGVAAGLAKTAFGSLIPEFAQGGLVTGPTVGLIGEGIGTNASNPEVIAPLDRLKNFIGGGSQNVIVEGVIKGNDIFLSNRNTGTNRQRIV